MKTARSCKLLSSALAICACLASGTVQAAEPGYEVHTEKSIMVPMRDGAVLSTDLYMPKGLDQDLPTILVRTVYGKNSAFGWNPVLELLVQRGYVVAIQDIRGRYESTGRFRVATNRRQDGDDTIDWVIDQPWSSGKVAGAGCSYLGETQVVMAATRHPAFVTAIPMSAATGFYAPGRAWSSYDGGVFELAQTAGWFAGSGTSVYYQPPDWVDRREWFTSEAAKLFRQDPEIDFDAYLPLLETLPTATILQRAGLPPTEYDEFVASLPDGDYYREKDWAQADDQFNIPAIIMDSWYDYGAAESLQLFKQFQDTADSAAARDNQFIIIGPSTHCGYPWATEQTIVGERDLGDARLDFTDIQLRWYDHWMKGIDNGITEMPKVQYYLMGKNEWRQADEWPVPGTREQRWYLDSGGAANSRRGDGVLSLSKPQQGNVDRFTYDPAAPVPSLGGHTCCTGTDTEAGGYDQSEIEMRHDVLVYTSEPLEEGIEVTGALEVVLQVSSSAVDTDFMAKLVDVYPDGRAFNIQEGALRMRHREGLDREVMMEPGSVYEARLDLHVTSNFFGPGHRIRLEVSSSNFPRFERNLNTGGDNHRDTEWQIAINQVHHSGDHLSWVALPVVENRAD
jgi:putative CocE/NonD family hydrolase